jgi:hypothetical protein
MIIDLYTIHQVEFTRTSITRAVKKILRSNSGKVKGKMVYLEVYKAP